MSGERASGASEASEAGEAGGAATRPLMVSLQVAEAVYLSYKDTEGGPMAAAVAGGGGGVKVRWWRATS